MAKDCENNIEHLGHLGYWDSSGNKLVFGNGFWTSVKGVLELKGDEGKADLEEESSFLTLDRNFSKSSSWFQYEFNL